MKQILLSLMIGVGSSLIANAAFGAQFYEDANLSRLDNTINEAKTMWNKWAKHILVDNDQEKTKDLIIERFKVAEDQFKNNWKEYIAWNLETHFCCALALLKHAKMDLSDVLSCNGYIKYGLQDYLGLCILTAAECKERNIAVSIENYSQRAGLSIYLTNTGKLLAKMKEEKGLQNSSKETSTLTKLIIWSAYSARKEGKDFEKIVAEKDDIFDKAVIALESGTKTGKRDYNLRSKSPKAHEDVIEIHSSSDSATEILSERPHKNDSTQSMWRSVPRNQYEIKYYSSYFDDKYRNENP